MKIKNLWNQIKSSKFLRGFRLRIFLLVLLTGIFACVSMQITILQSYEKRAVEVKQSEVSTQLKVIANHLINLDYFNDQSSEIITAELDQLSDLYDGRVLIIDENLKIIKDTYRISEGKYMISEEVVKCFKGTDSQVYNSENSFIEMTIPITVKTTNSDGTEVDHIVGIMLTSISTETIDVTLKVLSKNANLLTAIIIIILFGISYVASKWLTKPLLKLTTSIAEVREGHSRQLADVRDYAETEHIVNAFNELLGRMQQLDDSRQEFVSNVSHELKTPITSIKVLAESLLSQNNAPVELYREFFEDIVKEIDRESSIINDLLQMVKMDQNVRVLDLSMVNINSLLELTMKRLRPIARKHDIELTLVSNQEVTASADEVKLTQAISNLVENAIKYNREHGKVHVILDADYQYYTITVSDTGIGIPEESLPLIYDRFYRVDKSRSREIGGTGLGLSITKSSILMHKGTINVESKEGEGTSFTVKLPLLLTAVNETGGRV